MVRSNFVKKILFVTCILLLAASIANFIIYSNGGFLIGGDQGLFILPFQFQYTVNSFFIWNQLNYTGYMYGIQSPISLLYLIVQIPVAAIFGLKLGNAIFLGIYYAIGAIGMFLLIFKLLKNFDRKIAYFSGIMSAIIFMIHIEPDFIQLSMPAIWLPWLFLSVLFLSRDVNAGKNTLISTAFVTLTTTMTISTGGMSYAIQNAIFITFLFTILIFLSKEHMPEYVKSFSLVVLITIMINIPMFFSSYIFSHNISSQFFSSYSYNVIALSSTPLSQSFISFMESSQVYINNGVIVPSLIVSFLLIVAFASIMILPKRRLKEYSIEAKLTLATLSIFLLFIMFSTLLQKPFGELFSTMLGVIPYFYIFRYPYTAAHYIFLFSVSFCFGIGSFAVIKKVKRRKIIYSLTILLVLTATVLYLCYYDFAFFNQSQLNIPTSVFTISNITNSDNGLVGIGILPSTYGFVCESWYTGQDIFTFFVNKPLFTGGSESYNKVPAEAYATAMSEFQTKESNSIKISNLFGIMGIKYIILQKDEVNSGQCGRKNPSFNITSLSNNLNASKNISGIAQFKDYGLYKNDNVVPLVYSANLWNVNSINLTGQISILENDNFNISDLVIFSSNSPFQYDKNANPAQIKNYSKPGITYQVKNPTTITVKIRNSTGPFYLILRQTYDNGWTTYYNNSTQATGLHIPVNIFANAWLINRTGNYSITIYYNDQTPTYFSLLISIAGIVCLVAIGYLGLKRHKGKDEKREKEIK